MKNEPSLGDWNNQTLCVVQALYGAISPNFRMVTLSFEDNKWRLNFFLEREISEDTEEVDDIVCKFEVQQEESNFDFRIVVGSEPIPWPAHPIRVVFRRRERSQEED